MFGYTKIKPPYPVYLYIVYNPYQNEDRELGNSNMYEDIERGRNLNVLC